MIIQLLISIVVSLTGTVEPTTSSHISIERINASYPRMIGGVNTKRNVWPWRLRVYYDQHFVCGGFLVSPNLLSTTSRCITSRKPSKYRIVLEPNDLREHDIFSQEITASQIVFHSKGFGSQHQIAFIRIEKPGKWNFKVQTGLLPEQVNVALVGSKYEAGVCYDTRATCFLDRRYCHLASIRRTCPATCYVCSAPPTKPPPPLPCGIPSIAQPYVMGGSDAKPGAWPWQAAIFANYKGKFIIICGGTLISQYYIVSAAHCFKISKNPLDYRVVLGGHDFGLASEKSRQVRKVDRIFLHPKYVKVTEGFDIAVILLSTPVTLNSRVRKVCLPAAHETVPIGTKCYITGWGVNKPKGHPYRILQQASLPIVSQATCKELNEKKFPYKITKTMLCAGYGPHSVQSGCHGDSGGPLVCPTGSDGAFKLHGVISWGSAKCKPSESYSVTARVSELRSFIYDKTWL